MQFWYLVKTYFKYHWIRLLASVVYCVLMLFLYNFIHHAFENSYFYFDGFFIGGATLFLFGLLTIVSYFGGFDMLSYLFRAKVVDNHRESLYDYSVRRRSERMPNRFAFIDYLVIGTIFMIVGAILL